MQYISYNKSTIILFAFKYKNVIIKNMSKHFKNITLFILIVFSLNINAQDQNIALLCSPRENSVLLRWAPGNPKIWRMGNEYGYIVKRYTVLQNKKIPKDIPETLLTPTPLKPQPIEQWEPFADEKYVSIAGECIYGSYYKGVPTAGNPHVAYKKYKEEQHRFSFALFAADQSVKAAELSGLYIEDKTAQPDEKYLYRVFINCPDSLATDTAYSFTGLSEYQPLPKPVEVNAEWGDKVVSLSWNILYLNHIYNSYIIEKSLDKGKTYKQLGENAIVQLTDKGVSPEYMYKSDTLPDNNTLVYYRVRGISPFGEIGPASDSIFGNGKLPIKTAPVITSYEVIDNELIKLAWEYPEDMNQSIAGFKIYRSPKPEGRKKLIYYGRNPENREFIDSTGSFTNYYLISVYNEHTEKLSPLKTYVERIDSFPPVPPVKLTGIIDTTGKVMLTWHQNKDEDLEGYRVYTSNSPKFEFLLVTPAVIYDTVYYDSINLKTLTKKIYYKVKAIDVRQNQSDFSELLTLEKPDRVPPVSPVIKDIANIKGKPELTWVNSSSSDVLRHHIYRKEKIDSIFKRITTIDKTNDIRSTYTDKDIEPGKEYIYYVAAEDQSGLISPPSNTGYFKTSSNIKESIKLSKKVYTDNITLSWTIKSEKQVQRILVYRSVNDEPMRLYGNSEEKNFIDNKLSPEKTYNYCIKAIYVDGSSSGLSNTITVKM